MDSILPTPQGPPPLWGPGSIPDNWSDVCGFLKPPGPQRCWKVNKHGAFFIRRKSLGLRPTDQSCHHETWLHLDFVDWSKTWSKQNTYEPRISLKERPAGGAFVNPKRRISEVMSDHSLSSSSLVLSFFHDPLSFRYSCLITFHTAPCNVIAIIAQGQGAEANIVKRVLSWSPAAFHVESKSQTRA